MRTAVIPDLIGNPEIFPPVADWIPAFAGMTALGDCNRFPLRWLRHYCHAKKNLTRS